MPVPMIAAARNVASALRTLALAWEATEEQADDYDAREALHLALCEGYPFGTDLDELVANAGEWAEHVAGVLNPKPATPEIHPLVLAEAAGWRAYIQNRPAAPAADPTVIDLITNLPVGCGAADIFRAFTRGRDSAAAAAAAIS